MNRLVLLLLIIQAWSLQLSSQDENTVSYRIMFYNVENYFDAQTDSSLSYNEFTPEGDLHWTPRKFEAKRNALYKVITAVGQWSLPAIIGLVEVENDEVLTNLIQNTPLNKKGYQIIHFDSPDFRGIDAAMLYGPEFELLNARPIKVSDPQDAAFTTRDMLYAKGVLSTDTLHIIINHWTSRYRGLLESEPKRILQANLLLQLTDSICQTNPKANLLIMGDFNDSPENTSMQLLSRHDSPCTLTNLPMQIGNKNVKGTLKFQGNWSIFDQLLVSKNMLNDPSSPRVINGSGTVFTASFILEEDHKFGGVKPNRTNVGFTYHGGFSDHLPVFLDLILSK